MYWKYRIGKEGERYGIIEMYYRNKFKIIGYTEFLHIGNSKQDILNDLKKVVKNTPEEGPHLNNSNNCYTSPELREMISDILKNKIINLEDINIWPYGNI